MTRALLVLFVFIDAGSMLLVARQPAVQSASFVNQLAQAMSRRDRAAVADMVRYPLAAFVSGVEVPVANRDQLLKLYDGLFTAELRCLVEESATKGAGAIRAGCR